MAMSQPFLMATVDMETTARILSSLLILMTFRNANDSVLPTQIVRHMPIGKIMVETIVISTKVVPIHTETGVRTSYVTSEKEVIV